MLVFPVNGFIPYGMPSFSNFKGFDYNPKKAQQLIKSSDFDLNTNIIISPTSSYLDLSEYIQNELKNLGLNISIDVNPPSTHRQLVATSKLSVFRQVGLLIIQMRRIIYPCFTVKIYHLMVPIIHIFNLMTLMIYMLNLFLKLMIVLDI